MSQRHLTFALTLVLAMACPRGARAQEYPEAVIQWGVTSGESCEDIAKVVYGSVRHAHLVARYNRVSCKPRAALAPATLVLPAKVTEVARARLGSLARDVRLKPPGSGWGIASAGQALLDNSSVNTLEEAHATIQFVDTTRIQLSENTLIIIFGTAATSSISSLRAADLSVDSGEIKAALRALRGEDAVEIDVSGGRVSALSKDTVISAKGTRTNVAVFNGRSKVRSQGTSVNVNEGFGTSFEKGKAPEDPRALPKAPTWKGALPSLTLAEPARGIIEAAWEPTEEAVSYRVELAKDAEFFQLLAREEVAKEVTSFRAENLTEGTYFLRVRVLDKDEFLGIATTAQTTTVIGVSVTGQAGDIVQPGKLTVHPYGSLALSNQPSELSLALDDGAATPAPQALEFGKLRPHRIELAIAESKQRWELAYVEVKAEISARSGKGEGEGIDFAIALDPIGDAANFARMRGALLTIEDGVLTTHSLGAPTMEGTIARTQLTIAGAPQAAMLVDGWGRTLGTWEQQAPDAVTPPPVSLGPPRRAARPYAPIVSPWSIDPAVPRLWAPTAQNAIYASIATVRPIGVDSGEASEPGVQGLMEIAGNIETVSLEAAFRTNDSTTARSENEIAWIGARYRIVELDEGLLDVGPGLRLGFPTADGGPSFQAELGVAAAGRKGMWGWIADVVVDVDGEPVAYPYVPSLATGVLVQPMPWFCAFAAIDLYATRKLVNELGIITDGLDPRFAGGLSLGAEAGHFIFGALGLRATPFEAPRQDLTFTAALGLRTEE